MSETLDEFRRRREAIRSELGGRARVESLRAAGRRTVRERIDAFVDPGSFEELGTFARSANPEDREATPGDGKVGGHAHVDGRPVTVAGDDITVRRASSSVVGSRKLQRLYEQALRMGHPLVYFGETGGARIPDTLGSEGFAQVPAMPLMAHRRRRVPMACAIVGESFGGSSFFSALSDFVVQVRGSCLAVTSPRVIEVATGERVDREALGGVDVHTRLTGQIDVAVEDEDAAFTAVRRFLGYLPSNSRQPPPRRESRASLLEADPELAQLVPERRRRAYDMRHVLRRLVDDGDFLELRPGVGRGLITALARLDGMPVGIIASQPLYQAGSLEPDACDKATRLVCLCDAFGLPLVLLQDTPGFLVGQKVEHSRLLHKAMLFQQALVLAGVPKLTVVLRKAFGLAFFSLGGSGMGSDFLAAWPGAEIGFMDPEVAANVLMGGQVAELPPEEKRAQLQAVAGRIASATDPYGAATIMGLDEVIAPEDTRAVLVRQLRLHAEAPFQPGDLRPLSMWPTCW